MSDLGAEAIAAVYSGVADARAQVRYGGTDSTLQDTSDYITEAICTNIERSRIPTDEGVYNSADGIVRYEKADEPTTWSANDMIVGELVEVLLHGDTDWNDAVKVRVAGRNEVAGGVRLNVAAEFEEA